MISLQHVFEESVQDLYNAEKTFLKGMERMAKHAENERLIEGLRKHEEQTQEQIRRLEQIAELGGFKPTGKTCPVAQALVTEAGEHLKEDRKKSPIMDAVIIASAQKNEHYEIAAYGTLKALAQEMGMQDAVKLLDQTLQEEEQTDKLLTDLAESEVNPAAVQAEAAMSESGKASLK